MQGPSVYPRATDLQEVDFALASAGFTAMQLWKAKGTQLGMAGVFPWTYAQYVELASMSGASWWSQPDLCCEPEIAANREEVDYRVRATATLLEGVLRIVYGWQNELARTCSPRTVASMLPPPVPVIQGWSPDDYLRSLDLLDKVWSRWQPWLAAPALMGVGSGAAGRSGARGSVPVSIRVTDGRTGARLPPAASRKGDRRDRQDARGHRRGRTAEEARAARRFAAKAVLAPAASNRTPPAAGQAWPATHDRPGSSR